MTNATACPWTELRPDGRIAIGSNTDRRRTAIVLEHDEWVALLQAARAGELDPPALRARTEQRRARRAP